MELYHCLNRGVDKRPIVKNDKDRVRFVHELYAMNNALPAGNAGHFLNMDLRSPYLDRVRQRAERQLLVDIHGWCLMDNHYHLLVSERVQGGLTKFLRKFNIGYANYFNEKYGRSGALYQGRTKRIHIVEEPHFNHILHYIHCNPLDMEQGFAEWRGSTIATQDTQAALQYLSSYRWSSCMDYLGIRNFPSTVHTALFRDVFDNYTQALKRFLESRTYEVPTEIRLE